MLVVPARNVEEIPEVVKTAAAELLGSILTLVSGIRRERLQGFRWRQLTWESLGVSRLQVSWMQGVPTNLFSCWVHNHTPDSKDRQRYR